MQKKYLPIGSVCTLKGQTRKVMITGYYSVKFNGNLRINDYRGCVYPEGLLISDYIVSFNHDDIEKVDFIGFKNTEQEKFMNLFDKLTGNISDEEKAKEFHEQNEMFLTSNSVYSKILFDENGVVMIADPVEEAPTESKYDLDNIKFDETGTVIGIDNNTEIHNPFHKEYETPASKSENSNIFGNVEFDENGVVISNESDNSKDYLISEIKFDENGTVIPVGRQELEQNYNKYRFDENGVLISERENEVNEVTVASETQESNESKEVTENYKFDENGVVTSEENILNKDDIKFDENGVVISDGKNELSRATVASETSESNGPKEVTENYKFDENGTLIAVDDNTKESTDNGNSANSSEYSFDENGVVVSG